MFAPPSGPQSKRPASAQTRGKVEPASKAPITPVGWPFDVSALGYPQRTAQARGPAVSIYTDSAPRSPNAVRQQQYLHAQQQASFENDLVESLGNVWSEGKTRPSSASLRSSQQQIAKTLAKSLSGKGSESSSKLFQPKKQIVCSIHKSLLQQFCVECQVALCHDCLTLGVHSHHHHVSISRAAADTRASLHGLIADVEASISNEYSALENLENDEHEFRQQFESAQQTLSNAFSRIRASLDAREAEMMNQLKRASQPWQQAFYDRRAHYTLELEAVVGRTTELQQRLEQAGDDAVAQSAKVWTNTIENDLNRLPTIAVTLPPLPPHSELEAHVGGVDELAQQIAQFGTVRLSSGDLCVQNTVLNGPLVPVGLAPAAAAPSATVPAPVEGSFEPSASQSMLMAASASMQSLFGQQLFNQQKNSGSRQLSMHSLSAADATMVGARNHVVIQHDEGVAWQPLLLTGHRVITRVSLRDQANRAWRAGLGRVASATGVGAASTNGGSVQISARLERRTPDADQLASFAQQASPVISLQSFLAASGAAPAHSAVVEMPANQMLRADQSRNLPPPPTVTITDRGNGEFDVMFIAVPGAWVLHVSVLTTNSSPTHTLPSLPFAVRDAFNATYHGDLTDELDTLAVPAHKMLAHSLLNHGTEFRGPGGIAIDHGRRVMFVAYADLNCVKVIHIDDGTVLRVIGSTKAEAGCEPEHSAAPMFNQPRSLALDESRSCLFVADSWNHRIVVVDVSTGARLQEWPPRRVRSERERAVEPFLDRPYGLAVAGDTLWVSDCYNHRVLALAWRDNFARLRCIGELGVYSSSPRHLCYPFGLDISSARDELYVSDQHNHRIQVYRASDGQLLRSIGGPLVGPGLTGPPPSGGVAPGGQVSVSASAHRVEPGTLRHPTDCLIDQRRGLLYVCDRGHSQVQVFCAADGSFVGVFGQRGGVSAANAVVDASIARAQRSMSPSSQAVGLSGSITAGGALKGGRNVAGATAPPAHGAAGLPLQLADGHAALLAAEEAQSFLSPMAFAKPFDALHGEVWVSDCDAMRMLCWGAFMP